MSRKSSTSGRPRSRSVDDLIGRLFQFASAKKQALQEERKRIMEEGFVEREMKILTKTLHALLQAEVDRYLCFAHLIKGYYRGLEQKPVEDFAGLALCAPNYDVPATHTGPARSRGQGW